LGLEISGEIVEYGCEVKNWQLNDKVFGLVSGGGYAQYAVIKAAHLFHLPNKFDYFQGAAIAEVYLTAFQSLFEIAKLVPNSSVLIHAGASGVGTAAIQLAKIHDCLVTVTTSSEIKAQACLAVGADHVINYKEVDFVAWSKQNHKNGFDVIIDVVGGDYLTKNVDVAAQDGHIVILSMLAGRYCQQIDIAKLLIKRLTISASTLRNRSNQYKTNLVTAFNEQFSGHLTNGQVNPVIDTIYSWKEADKAHQQMKTNQNIGKIILSVD
jgi:putative PIG3 family NAD(P)H quinone oxidoreductase